MASELGVPLGEARRDGPCLRAVPGSVPTVGGAQGKAHSGSSQASLPLRLELNCSNQMRKRTRSSIYKGKI